MRWLFPGPTPDAGRGRFSFRKIASIAAILAVAALGVWESFPSSRQLVRQVNESSAAYQKIGYLPDLYVAYVAADTRMFGIEDHFIYVSEDHGRSFRQLGALPKVNPGWRDRALNLLARSKLVRSVRRNQGPSKLVVLSTGTILVFWDHIYRSADNGRTFTPVFDFSEQNVSDSFPNGEGLAVGPDDTVYFGEYSTSKRPNEVKIYEGREDGTVWKTAHAFGRGEIFHVHGIQYDPYRLGYWIMTGDLDSESKIMFTGDGFKSFRVLGEGTQDWRVVSVMITKDRLIWGSDNDQASSSIFQWDFGGGGLTKLQAIGKPSYSSRILADGTFVLSTAYEPDSPFTQMSHPEPTTDLWTSSDGIAWTKLLSLRHETRQLASGLSRAQIAFPGGAKTRELFFIPLWTAEAAFTTQLIQPTALSARSSP
jgi:hypothetical protein